MRTARHRLAARRNMLGLTQEALAERLEVAVSTVARWEQGATAPRAWQRGPLADVLGVTLNQLDELLAADRLGLSEALAPVVDEPGDVVRDALGSSAPPSLEADLRPEAPVDQHRDEVPRAEGFVGRAREVREIVEALEHHRAVAVVGRRGAGSSVCAWAAVHCWHDREPARPAFYVDLRPEGRPTPLDAALGRLTHDLGSDSFAALRDRLAGQRALLVLDNVGDPDQVRALVPLPEPGRVLLVGGPELGSGSVHAVPVDEPGPDEATELFEAASVGPDGPTVNRMDPAVRELVDLCGRQPRAITGLARGVARGPLNIEGALETLRLAAAAPPHQPVRFSLAAVAVAREDVAYGALSPGSRRLFRRLGLVPEYLGRDAVLTTEAGEPRRLLEGELTPRPVALEAMATLAGRSIRRVGGQVEELSRGRFLQPVPSVASAEVEEGGRYELRPLLAAYARLHVRHEEPAWRRARIQVRLTRYLARKAERWAERPSTAGREWFACHHQLLAGLVTMATSCTGDRAASLPRPLRRWWFRLARALCLWYADEGRLDEWWTVCEAVQRWERAPAQGWVRNERGVILRRQGHPRAAIAELNKALSRRGRRGEAQVLTNRGLAFLDLGSLDAAIVDFKRAAQRRSPRDRVGIGLTELGLGVAYLRSGAASDARRHLVKAADAFDRADELRGSASARTNLVLAEWETGAHNAAVEAGEMALEKYAALERLTGKDESEGRAAVHHNLALCREGRTSP